MFGSISVTFRSSLSSADTARYWKDCLTSRSCSMVHLLPNICCFWAMYQVMIRSCMSLGFQSSGALGVRIWQVWFFYMWQFGPPLHKVYHSLQPSSPKSFGYALCHLFSCHLLSTSGNFGHASVKLSMSSHQLQNCDDHAKS